MPMLLSAVCTMINHVSKRLKVVFCTCWNDRSLIEFQILGENGYLAGIEKGAVHVSVTTITPDAADRLEKLHEEHGAHYVTGTVCIVGRESI